MDERPTRYMLNQKHNMKDAEGRKIQRLVSYTSYLNA